MKFSIVLAVIALRFQYCRAADGDAQTELIPRLRPPHLDIPELDKTTRPDTIYVPQTWRPQRTSRTLVENERNANLESPSIAVPQRPAMLQGHSSTDENKANHALSVKRPAFMRRRGSSFTERGGLLAPPAEEQFKVPEEWEDLGFADNGSPHSPHAPFAEMCFSRAATSPTGLRAIPEVSPATVRYIHEKLITVPVPESSIEHDKILNTIGGWSGYVRERFPKSEELDCPICKEGLSSEPGNSDTMFAAGKSQDTISVYCPICNQASHVNCLATWLVEHHTCPFCRAEPDFDDGLRRKLSFDTFVAFIESTNDRAK